MMPNFPRRPNIGNEALGFGSQPSGQFRQNALAGLGSPQSSMTGPGAPAQPQNGGFGAFLTGLGYTGPMRGTDEFRDARQAGERPYMDFLQDYRQANPGAHPWMDWRQSQGFQGWPGGPNMHHWGPNANTEGPRPGMGWGGGLPYLPGGPQLPQTQGVAYGEPSPGWGDMGRRPNVRPPR